MALQGTKTGRDLVTDLNFWLRPIWDQDTAELPEQLVSAASLTPFCLLASAYPDSLSLSAFCAVCAPGLPGPLTPRARRGAVRVGAAAPPAAGLLRTFPGRCSSAVFSVMWCYALQLSLRECHHRLPCVTRIGLLSCRRFQHCQGLPQLIAHACAGAIAVLCTLRLLRELGDFDGSDSICCFTFGMPAIGNAALADHVSLRGWHRCFSSFVLPGSSS